MAIWQTCYRVFGKDGRSAPSHREAMELGKALEAVLPLTQSWSTTIFQWGDIDSTVLEVHAEGEHDEGISLRIDARESWATMLSLIWSACDRLSLSVCTLDGTVLTSEEEFVESMKRSDACEFMVDPHEFLRKVGERHKGGSH